MQGSEPMENYNVRMQGHRPKLYKNILSEWYDTKGRLFNQVEVLAFQFKKKNWIVNRQETVTFKPLFELQLLT